VAVARDGILGDHRESSSATKAVGDG
jgi:hypothetical protein